MSFDLSNPGRTRATMEEIEAARREYGSTVIEIDDDAKVSIAEDPDDPGLWIEGWLWLSQKLDEEIVAAYAEVTEE